MPAADQPFWLTFIVGFILMNVLLVGMAYMTWFERKVLAAHAGSRRSQPDRPRRACCSRSPTASSSLARKT